MGWFDSWFGSGSGESDPLRKLDPKLREFLEKESPVKFNKPSGGADAAPEGQPRTAAEYSSLATSATSTASQLPQPPKTVPSESLYPDGRYADLWKTYRPLAAVEAETKSDHEKLMDVLDGFKERKARIGKAALENCALEQLDWNKCMKSGDWTARLTMCRAEARKFERCYTMQSRLLKALGYLSTYDRPPEVDEELQMHADALYHRMLEQEAAIEAAKAEGRPVPTFAPVIPKVPVVPGAGTVAGKKAEGGQEQEFDVTQLPPELQKKFQERIEKVPEEERLAEAEAIKGELRAKAELAARVQGLWEEQAKEREARKAEGKETIGDRISALLGKR
ncbi:hypothetical protein VTK73DRAFT_8587 [Phialemonium thermophilum]|uniref:Autophagy protein n=1 Tax=Phialemonium thermophilum TaxID=223376 RepID=A0ABR3W7U8_9PEZI